MALKLDKVRVLGGGNHTTPPPPLMRLFFTFFSDKTTKKSQGIILKEGNEIRGNKTDVADKLNDYFVNIVETGTGKKPRDLTSSRTGVVDETTIAEIVEL